MKTLLTLCVLLLLCSSKAQAEDSEWGLTLTIYPPNGGSYKIPTGVFFTRIATVCKEQPQKKERGHCVRRVFGLLLLSGHILHNKRVLASSQRGKITPSTWQKTRVYMAETILLHKRLRAETRAPLRRYPALRQAVSVRFTQSNKTPRAEYGAGFLYLKITSWQLFRKKHTNKLKYVRMFCKN